MKTFLQFLLAACLVLGLATGSLAAIHGFQGGFYGDFLTTGGMMFLEVELSILTPGDRLFSVEEQGPRLEVEGLFGYDGPDLTLARLEYYQNDFVFGDVLYISGGIDLTDLRGGYLWEDLGIFAGIDYLAEGSDSGYIASGGYRFDLGDGGYAALSLNYYGGEYGGEIELEAHAKYLADGLKITGQLFINEDGDYVLHGKANVAAGDDLTWGGGLLWTSGDFYIVFAGLTWETGSFLFDGLVSMDDDGDTSYSLSGLYDVSDTLALGIAYSGNSDSSSGFVTLKGECVIGQGALTCFYTTDTDGGSGGYIGLGYEMSL